MQLTVYIIDTFTSEAFRGNPSGVCWLQQGRLDTVTAQAIAAELNYPVTVFIKQVNEAGPFELTYFTPITEIPACGHATLAAGRMLFEELGITDVTFRTAGIEQLPVCLQEDIISITYPRYGLQPAAVSAHLLQSLSIDGYLSAGSCTELETLFLELEDAHVLKTLQPDFQQLMTSAPDIKEVVITARSDIAGYDYLLRSFCPWIGIDEDPVTGSVQAVLAPFWQNRLQKSKLVARQCSARGGDIFVTALHNTVELGGKTVILLKGAMTLPAI